MGTDCFQCLKAPLVFSFQFIIDTVTIFEAENQNTNPSARFELVEVPNVSEGESNVGQMKPQGQESKSEKEIIGDGKKKGKVKSKKKKKGKDKKKGKGKEIKKKPPKPAPVEKPATLTKRKHIYLPPLRISLRYFFNRTAIVNQIDLPDIFRDKVNQQEDAKLINNLAFDKAKKGKGKTGKGKTVKREKRGKRGKKGKKKNVKKKKVKEVKPQVIPREPSLEWVSDDYYR